MSIVAIQQQLKILRMPEAASYLEPLMAEKKRGMNLECLSQLLQAEIESRKNRSIQNRIRSCRFPEITGLENFDFTFNPEISEEKIKNLFNLRFIDQKNIVLLLGPPGVGKTHIATAIGLEAIYKGKRVFCSSMKRLANEIRLFKARNNLDVLFKKILSAHLWIIDDWGVVTLDKAIAEEVFDLIDRRKQTTSLILTSNRAIEEWAEVFPDAILANATVDRLFEQATIIVMNGKSYRLKSRINIESQSGIDILSKL